MKERGKKKRKKKVTTTALESQAESRGIYTSRSVLHILLLNDDAIRTKSVDQLYPLVNLTPA